MIVAALIVAAYGAHSASFVAAAFRPLLLGGAVLLVCGFGGVGGLVVGVDFVMPGSSSLYQGDCISLRGRASTFLLRFHALTSRLRFSSLPIITAQVVKDLNSSVSIPDTRGDFVRFDGRRRLIRELLAKRIECCDGRERGRVPSLLAIREGCVFD